MNKIWGETQMNLDFQFFIYMAILVSSKYKDARLGRLTPLPPQGQGVSILITQNKKLIKVQERIWRVLQYEKFSTIFRIFQQWWMLIKTWLLTSGASCQRLKTRPKTAKNVIFWWESARNTNKQIYCWEIG